MAEWEVQTFGQGLFALDSETCPRLLSVHPHLLMRILLTKSLSKDLKEQGEKENCKLLTNAGNKEHNWESVKELSSICLFSSLRIKLASLIIWLYQFVDIEQIEKK